MNGDTQMLLEGWAFEGLAFKFDFQEPVLEDIAPWKTVCITWEGRKNGIVSVWSRDETKDGLQ